MNKKNTGRVTNNPKGRPKGTPNKLGASAKENIQFAFVRMGGREALSKWAADNPKEFYRIYSKLLPHELTGPMGNPIQVVFTELQSKGL